MSVLLSFLYDVALAQGANGRVNIPQAKNSYGLPSMSNPTGGTSGLVNRLAGTIINVAFGFIATFAVAGVMWGGFLILKGGEEGMKQGKQAIAMSLLGLLIAIMSYTIVSLVIGFNPLESLGLLGD